MKQLTSSSWILYLSSLLLLFASCKTSKIVQSNEVIPTLETQTADYLLTQLSNQEIAVDWVNAKAKITFKDVNKTQNFKATIRMRTDSLIWMNVKKLNVEGARILINKDSVYIINRIDKEYYIKGLDYLEDTYNLPANFEALQTMILGNPYFFKEHQFKVSSTEEQYRLSSEKGTNTLSDYWVNGSDYGLEQMSFLDLRNSRKLVVGYEDYQLLGPVNFSHRRNFKMESEQTGDVEVIISFSTVELDVPKSMPFSISSRYKRVD